MISVSDALSRILSAFDCLGDEEVALLTSLGRVLATDIKARRTHPPFAISAMDGYAIRAEDAPSLPASLEIIGESAAGNSDQTMLGKGEAVRIFTGAPLPKGANCIVIQENCTRKGNHLLIKEGKVIPRQFVRQAGLDFNEGDLGLRKGKMINARDIAFMAAMNWAKLRVVQKPRIAILSTGNELVEPGELVPSHHIVNSNSYGLAAFVRACGAEPFLLGIAKDDISDIKQKLHKGLDHDLLVTIGGASVGDHDLVQQALKEEGLALNFWKIAMRPGKPLLFGLWDKMPVLGLPGNPVSVMVTSMIFLKPAIQRMTGRISSEDGPEYAQLDCDLPENDSRQDYLRATLFRGPDGTRLVHPFPKQDSSMMRLLTQADCLVIRRPFAGRVEKGQDIEILRFPENF